MIGSQQGICSEKNNSSSHRDGVHFFRQVGYDENIKSLEMAAYNLEIGLNSQPYQSFGYLRVGAKVTSILQMLEEPYIQTLFQHQLVICSWFGPLQTIWQTFSCPDHWLWYVAKVSADR